LIVIDHQLNKDLIEVTKPKKSNWRRRKS